MLHLNANVTAKKLGFSLIELLVVVAIIGILVAVAILTYNGYRANATLGALDSTGTNVIRAFQACITLNAFTGCDTLTELKVTVSNLQTVNPQHANAPNYCVGIEDEIGGETFKGCYSVNAATNTVDSTYNDSTCFVDDGAGTPANSGNQAKESD